MNCHSAPAVDDSGGPGATFAGADVVVAAVGAGLAAAGVVVLAAAGTVVPVWLAGASVLTGAAGTVPLGCAGGSFVVQPSMALTIAVGFTGAPPRGWTSKCRCGPAALPVLPIQPMTSPATTFEPTDRPGANADRWA